MTSHAIPRSAAVFVESTFKEAPPDWNVGASVIYVIEPDVSSLEQVNLPNENIVDRRLNPHQMIRGLKSGSTVGLSMYMTASGANAVTQASSIATPQTDVMRAALGGRKLGFAAELAGGTAAAPEIDADPGFVAGDWLFVFDPLTAKGEFYEIQSLAALVVTFDRDLHFVPAAGNPCHAVISVFPYGPALDDHGDVEHTTLSWLVQGDAPGDVYELLGCKPAIEVDGITAGEPVKLTVENMVTDWTQYPTQTALVGAPAGIAPNVAGTGCSTYVRISDFGSPLAEVLARGSITPNLAISWDPDAGPNGCEGVHGYVGTGTGEGGPALVVDYDRAYDDDWLAETLKHVYIQVGAAETASWAINYPRVEYRSTPKRVDEGGLTSHSLDFRALSNTADTTGLAGVDLGQRQAPFVILIVA